ncbi:hypothetical protein BAY59_10160 [Prauserella coralliicola]|nr:hypothetical protein BAY59_10160 [Prauserella coralliicola]
MKHSINRERQVRSLLFERFLAVNTQYNSSAVNFDRFAHNSENFVCIVERNYRSHNGTDQTKFSEHFANTIRPILAIQTTEVERLEPGYMIYMWPSTSNTRYLC